MEAGKIGKEKWRLERNEEKNKNLKKKNNKKKKLASEQYCSRWWAAIYGDFTCGWRPYT